MDGVSGEADEEVEHFGSEFEQLQGVYKIINISGAISRIDFKF